jgi:hypothetical protein
MENPPAPAEPSKPWSFNLSFSYDGPGLPSRARTVEFLRSLSRRDLAVIGGVLAFIFIIEPLLLYWLFSARIKSRLDANTEGLRVVIASQIQAEVGPAVKEALSQNLRLVTPLDTSKAGDSTGLVLSSEPPPPAKSK